MIITLEKNSRIYVYRINSLIIIPYGIKQIEYVCLFFKCVLSVSFELLPLIEEIDDR